MGCSPSDIQRGLLNQIAGTSGMCNTPLAKVKEAIELYLETLPSEHLLSREILTTIEVNA